MASEISRIFTQIIESAPPGELEEVYNYLVAILPDKRDVIEKCVIRLAETHGIVLPGEGIACNENKDASGKFWDYKQKKKYNASYSTAQMFDVEPSTPVAKYPTFYSELVKEVDSYSKSHFPSDAVFEVIPHSSTKVNVILISEKLNKSNFYTGRWKAAYTFEEAQKARGNIVIDVHYYEEGNVRFKFDEAVEKECDFSPAAIVRFIQRAEDEVQLRVVNQFTVLNQNYFKNLRRLLPVTKSRINWGAAIGNYKLGTDVISEQ